MNPASPNPGTLLAKIGALAQIGPLVGLSGTVWGMVGAFETLAASGVGDPEKLSAAIGDVLVSTAVGILFGLAGIILLVIAITFCRYRAPWAFWFLTIYGALLILAFPFGTPFGLFFVIYCQMKKNEFLTPNLPPV